MMRKAFIEVDFPLKEVSEESVKEKTIRHGHISTLHIWWARRPLAASRSTIFAALTPEPRDKDELKRRLSFIAKLSKWENSLNQTIIDEAKELIREANGGRPPKVLDCFAGGGSIPLEALRLGCETYALDYNPVATLILKAVLEYPQKYGRMQVESKEGLIPTSTNPLLDDVKKWGNWVLEEARKEIGKFYPPDPDGGVPVGYIWARTIKCQNPSCGAEIPLMRQFWLARKENKKISLKLISHKKTKMIEFKIVEGKETETFDPSQGTTSRATVLCPICGGGVDASTVRREAREGRMGQRLIAIVLHKAGRRGKTYRLATENDLEAFKKAEKYLERKKRELFDKWGFDPVPNEPLKRVPVSFGVINVWVYGMNKWGDLFNSRQKLALITFVDKIRQAHEKMLAEGIERKYAKAIVTYLAILLDGVVDHNSGVCQWRGGTEDGGHTFGRQALPMTWDYFEINPLSESTGSVQSGMQRLLRVIQHLSTASFANVAVTQGSATELPWPEGFFNAVVIDPPYYDNVPYSYLSDFFYVWLKRTIGDLYPELFATPLTPKSEEIVAYSHGENGFEGGKKFFEEMITKAFKEIYRILTPDGISVIVFAYKSTGAWETIINSILKSGLVLTASWPIHTEMEARLRAKESAALASSVYMVCRKMAREDVGYFNEVKDAIDRRVREKLEQFWEQGIRGADFFVSAIGPAVEVFGRYSKVEKLSGEEVSVSELLEYIRKVVSEFALGRILKRPDLGGVDAATRFYLLWRWTFNNARVHFDDARKITQSVGGIELTELWDGPGLVRKEKEYVRVLGPKDRVFTKKERPETMIDALHQALVLWDRGDRKKMQELLEESGYLRNEVFWQVAQAISEVLPKGDKEKQLIQGFLYGKESYVKGSVGETSTLFDYIKSEKE